MPTVKFLWTAGEDELKAPKQHHIKAMYKSRCKKVVWDTRAFKQLKDQVGAEEDRRGVGGHSI
jgi:hypothetical protein